MGALGHRSAVAEVLGVPVSGFPAWLLWRAVYLMKLPGWGRRLKVAADWTLDLFLPAELVQLKLQDTMGIGKEHFEPGQAVFHQGDLGDRIYIIVSGAAEVVREQDGHEIVLAQLGAGEYFGEMALVENRPRTATIRCTTPMDVISLPKREFNVLTAHLPEMRRGFEQVIGQRRQANALTLARTNEG
jgi:NADH dehydrogenase